MYGHPVCHEYVPGHADIRPIRYYWRAIERQSTYSTLLRMRFIRDAHRVLLVKRQVTFIYIIHITTSLPTPRRSIGQLLLIRLQS